MEEEINYLDLLILKKIDAESSVERFGSHINTSFFETANLLGGMKIKGLIEIQTAIGGQSPITITGYGTDIIAEAERKYAEPLDTLDRAILHTLAGGVRDLQGLSSVINIRPKDLAFHLYKLRAGNYIEHEVRSAKVSFLLTEKGFNLVGMVRAIGAQPQAAGAAKPPALRSGIIWGQSAQPANVPAQPVGSTSRAAGGEGMRLAGDDEINDILNFGAVRKKEAPGGKLEQKSPAGHHAPPAGTGVSASTGSAPGAAGGPGGFAQGAAMPSAEAQKRIPEFAQTRPARHAASVKELDRQEMLASKFEFYAKQYLVYGILLAVLVLLLVAAIVFALLTRGL
ncbi:MAG: hypothetical protein V1728_05945 [Candidatus Micrarchaeota archaeon]